jgi:chorismate dehydratase
VPNLRISAISFLNTAPLMWDWNHGTRPAGFDVVYDVPSTCAEALRTGRADIGIIPSITYQTIPDLVVLPGVAIAARNPVRSILLVSKVPLEQVRTVALDTSSRTSVALLRIIFEKWYGGPRPSFAMEPAMGPMLARADAGLLIGDAALTVKPEGLHTYDLAELWQQHTGKPFVFAFWAVRAAAARPGLAEVFRRSRDHGLEPASLDVLAREWGPKLGLAHDDVVSYLTFNINYELDDANLSGLRLFYQYASEIGAIEGVNELRISEDFPAV